MNLLNVKQKFSAKWRESLGAVGNLLALIRATGGTGRVALVGFATSLGTAFFEAAMMALIVPILDLLFNHAQSASVSHISLMKFVTIPVPEVLQGSRGSVLAFLMGLLFFSTVAKSTVEFLGSYAFVRIVYTLVMNIRQRVFARLLAFSKSFFDTSTQGHLYNLVINHGVVISSGIFELRTIFYNGVFMLLYSGILFAISWKLTLVGAFLLPAYYYGLRIIIRKMRKTSSDYTQYLGDLSQAAGEVLGAIPLILSYGTQTKEKVKFGKIAETVRNLEVSLAKKGRAVLSLEEVFMMMLLVTLALIAYGLILRGSSTSGSEFLVYFLVLRRLSPTISSLTHSRVIFERMNGNLMSLIDVFDDKGKSFVPSGKIEFTGLKNGVEFRDTTFSYVTGNPVLKGISFSMPRGKMTAIVGPSGSGKTTIMGLLQRFYDCPPGTIFLDGIDIRDYQSDSIRKHCAVVSQEIFLFNTTLRENLCYGLERPISENEMTSVLQRASLQELVSRLPDGLETFIGDRGVRLSGGEKQRVSIARAMLKRAEILILDEATSALDTETERAIQRSMDELTKDQTVLVVAHRLSTILHADHLIVLEGGVIVEQGKVQELLSKKGRFYHYYSLQSYDSQKKSA